MDDGSAWTFGANGFGQLGDGTTTESDEPVLVAGTPGIGGGFLTMDMHRHHAVAVGNDGSVWSWGRNQWGQLGTGSQSPMFAPGSTSPVQAASLTGAISAGAGSGHSLVALGDGTVWSFGNGAFGQLGAGAITLSTTPVQAGVLSNAIAVDAGDAHSVALTANGEVYVWGRNDWGQLGDGSVSPASTVGSAVPVAVPGLTGIVGVACGANHTLALAADGRVWAWGDNRQGQLGASAALSAVPFQVPGLLGVTRIAASNAHSLAVRSDGTVWAWGLNWFGQLGNATQVNSATPVQTWNLPPSTGSNPALFLNQPGGSGAPVFVTNGNLIPGHEYYNIVSLTPCAAGPGTGPGWSGGLCIDVAPLLAQLAAPLGTPAQHFVATASTITWPAMPLPPITFDAVCVDVTGAVVLGVSPALFFSVQ